MKRYSFLYALLMHTFLVFVSVDGMELQQEQLLIKLQNDAKKENFIYPPDYFKPIAQKINKEYEIIVKYPERFPVLDAYEEQLKLHADRYIQQLIHNPSSLQEKKEELKKYFPENDPNLAEYLFEGLQKINALPKSKERVELETRIQPIVLHKKLQDEEEKKSLLREIISYDPESRDALRVEETLDFSMYTPEYFHAQKNEKQKEEDALVYIKYAISNKQWRTIEDKLVEIEKFLGQDTKFYLIKTLDSIPVVIFSKRLKEEELPDVGTVEDVTESKTQPKIITSEKTILEKQIIPYRKEPISEYKKEEIKKEQFRQETQRTTTPSSPGWISQIVSYVWEGINYAWKSIKNFFGF